MILKVQSVLLNVWKVVFAVSKWQAAVFILEKIENYFTKVLCLVAFCKFGHSWG
jgi:hypothetical protein